MTDKGKIIKGIGGLYFVKTASGIVECNARGKFRFEKIMPMIGDEVEVETFKTGKGYIKEIFTRKNSFVRPAVSNIDLMVIVASQAPPVTDLFLIDRMVAIVEDKEIEPIVVINKCDIDRGDLFAGIYEKSGIQTIRTSALTGQGRDELLKAMADKTVAFSGNSGVGKSSILNMIDSRFSLEVGTINERLGRGRHTTRHVELFELKNGAVVADTPGFSSFDSNEVEVIIRENIQYAFREFIPYIGQCKFTDCAHDKDDGCAVKRAAVEGKIAASRYESYIKMYHEAEKIKEWELDDGGK